jgi:hypothetical protein
MITPPIPISRSTPRPMLETLWHRIQANTLILLVSSTLMFADDAAMLAMMFC